MSIFFLDTSALVKRYIVEQGTVWIRALTDPLIGNTAVLSEVTLVEAAAALAARQRGHFITLAERDIAVDLLLRHADTEYALSPVTRTMVDQALSLTQRHRRRGYDAVQLATALGINAHYLSAGLPALTFLSADNDLNAAAQAEGLAAENPNKHP
jgi:hypothetical protein